MKAGTKRKMYMGIWGRMIPVPRAISAIGMRKSVSGARTNAARLSPRERRVHHFIVKEMAVVEEPITMDYIGEKLDMPSEEVTEIVEKLEGLKTFVYRHNSPGINWAYPLSLENTGHKITASTGERFFAA